MPLDFVPGYLKSSVPTPLPPIARCITYSTFHAGWLTKFLTLGYKFTLEIARRMLHFRGEPPALHPALAPGSPAAIVPHAEGPVAFDTPRIEYSEEDERTLDAYARATCACASIIDTMVISHGLPPTCQKQTVSSTWHAVSSPSLI